MSIGAYILIQSGDGNTFEGLPADLECAVTEIRVEQHLDRRCSFAIRLQEDFEQGEAGTITADELRGSKGLAIAVAAGPEELVCLICGQIEGSQAEVSVGGSGSSFDVRGRDLRTRAARARAGHRIPGTTNQIAETLAADFMTGDFHVGEAVAEYPEDQPYVFVGSKLDGLEQLSRLCDYPVWLSYRIERGTPPVGPDGRARFEILVDAHFEPSPPRGEELPPGAELDLAASGDTRAYLRIMGSETVCENVVNFSINSDNEAYSCVSSSVVDPDTGTPVSVDGQEAGQTPLTPNGEEVTTTGAKDCERKLLINKVGRPDIAASAARAAANEASWYVKASALTTVHMLGEVLQPHDLVEVGGGGCGINGVFQVEKVTHVINAASHWMHLDLRSNSRSLEPPREGLTNV